MRISAFGWGPDGWRRLVIGALLFGHLLWVVAGKGSSLIWQRSLDSVTWPARTLSTRWVRWREDRAKRLQEIRQLGSENQTLRSQLDELNRTRMSEAPRTVEAEEAIRLLGLRQQLPLEMKGARVVANLRQAPFGGLVVDLGKDAGLIEDQGVICPEGVIGRLWKVASGHASVVPLDAHNASTGVMLARSRATGVLQGVGPNRAEIRYISSQEVVQVGEPVLTSGLDGVYPRGLLVGYVSRSYPNDMELRIEVSLSAPLDRVHLVLILPARPEIELKPPGLPASKAVTRPRGKP